MITGSEETAGDISSSMSGDGSITPGLVVIGMLERRSPFDLENGLPRVRERRSTLPRVVERFSGTSEYLCTTGGE